MKQVTLRLPHAAFERLVSISGRYGVTYRGIFEAAATISFNDEFDPDRRETQLELWRVAGRLERSEAFRAEPRRKVIARLCDDLADQLAEACRRHGVSQNAALGLIVMPWPEEDTETFHRYREENLARIIDLARELDFQHRSRT